jgi:hypothetical protein
MSDIFVNIKDENVWVRNPLWLPIPEVDGSEEIIYLLVAVFEEGKNKVSSRLGGGGTTVDWGDGTITSYGSSIYMNHTYDFNSLPSSTEITTDEGIVYRQALIKMTSTTTWNGFWIFREGQTYAHQYLDIVAHVPNITSISNSSQTCPWLERISFPIMTPSVSMPNIFIYCLNLQQIDIDWTQPTNISNLSYIKVKDLGDIDLVNCTSPFTFTRTFDVKKIGTFKSYATNVGTLNLNGFEEVGPVYIYNDTNIDSFFLECHSIQGEINITAPAATSAQLLTRNCNKYSKLYFDAQNIQNINQLCYVAYSVQEVELTDASNVTSTSLSFTNAYSLQKLRLPGIKVSFDLTNTAMDAPNMVILFNDLADLTGLTSQNINITNTPASSNLTSGERDIALNKNWTITG